MFKKCVLIHPLLFFFLVVSLFISVQSCHRAGIHQVPEAVVLAFGSCDNQRLPNNLWREIDKHKPAVWIWGGDNIYCDTENMDTLRQCYLTKLNQPEYKKFISNKLIIGTWDDHDYGVNDGGYEYKYKKESQKLFFEFMKDAKKYHNQDQEGIYYAVDLPEYKVKIIVLDTRYFRSSLTVDPSGKKRYIPAEGGTMLGDKQWQWLEMELKNSKANLNLMVSSIQFISSEHGFEMWANMPSEQRKLENLLVRS